MDEKEKEIMDALDLTSERKEKEVMDALDLTNEIKERKKPKIPKGYTILKVNIKKEKKQKFWKLKKGLGKSFGNLIMKWIDEEYEKLYK